MSHTLVVLCCIGLSLALNRFGWDVFGHDALVIDRFCKLGL